MMPGRRGLLRAAPLLFGGLACAGALRSVATASAPVVTTRSGQVRGISLRGVRVFLGIPYGHVVGRFRPARTPAAWAGQRDASRFGPVAAQRLASGIASSEQCLSVNIFSPEANGSRAGLPVLVWVHGGANVSGASCQPIYDGTRFARSGVVCVTFNYRLGVFGFLELGSLLGAGYRGSGNNALRDQILLLCWVRDNIAAFGGDPGRVTLAGESAGAKDVAALLAAPAARGLFGRAILESGGGRTVLSMQAADAVSRRMLDLLELPAGQAARLLELDTARLIEAQHALMLDSPYGYPLRPLVDGALLPAMPEAAVAMGASVGVPLLLGTNHDESRLFLSRRAASEPLSGHALANMDAADFERMLLRYDIALSPENKAAIRWRALTTEEYWLPTVRLAEAQAEAGGAVWMYRFDKQAGSGPFAGRAAHVSELPYVWNNPDDPELAPLVAGFDPALATRVHAAWVAFISGAAPAAAGLPEWPRYDAHGRATMILDCTSRVEKDPDAAERRLWSRLFLAAPGR